MSATAAPDRGIAGRPPAPPPPPGRGPRSTRGSSLSVRRAVVQFALSGLVVVVLLGVVGVQLLRSTGRSEAIADAKRVNTLAARSVILAHLTPGVVAGRPAALRRFDHFVRRDVLGGNVVRVKLWDATGRIVYSDVPALIGTRYTLGEEELDALRSGQVDAEVSDLAKPENRFERRYGKLLEVYHGIHGPAGRRLLFETYLTYSSIAASGQRLWLKFLPALLGCLLLLELVQIPLAILLARRLRQREEERRALLERAMDASSAERRRLAGELHDGPVQSLAGVSFSLGAAGRQAGGNATQVGRAVEDAAARTRDVIRELRSMLVELYPARLRAAGLRAAVSDLLAVPAAAGLETECEMAQLDVSAEIEAVLFRAAREAIQNTVRHSGATRIEVRVETPGDRAVLTVRDDGRGFDPDAALHDVEPGHLGLRLVADLAAEVGGHLAIDSGKGRGTTLRLEVPLA